MSPDSTSHSFRREPPPSKPADSCVFIIADPAHHEHARLFYAYLKAQGVPAFLADPPRDGGKTSSERLATISTTLEHATHLVILISKDEHQDEDFVEHIYSTFDIEHLEQHKPGMALLLHVGPFVVEEVTPALRGVSRIERYSSDKFDEYMRILWPKAEEKPPDDAPRPAAEPDTGGSIRSPERGKRELLVPVILMVGVGLAVLVGALMILSLQGGGTTPLEDTNHTQIRITSVPAVGSSDQVIGMVDTDVINDHKVLVFIKVRDRWWGPKPGYDDAFTSINPRGEWRTTIFTGSEDRLASEIAAVLVPSSMNTAPEAHGEPLLPYQVSSYPLATAQRG